MDDIIFYFSSPANMVNDMYMADSISLKTWEEMLAEGWRHNGKLIFRTSHDLAENNELNYILPLRYQLKNFNFSKSQRKIFSKNQDLTHIFRPLKMSEEKHKMFEQHIQRFRFGKPDSIFNFVSEQPNRPFKTWELCVYKNDKLIACSFIDITKHSLSSTYAMFDLAESKRSLGIYTMILEIQYAIEKKKKYYYPGYAYEKPSFYEYKKKFDNVEFYDWQSGLWLPLNYVQKDVESSQRKIESIK